MVPENTPRGDEQCCVVPVPVPVSGSKEEYAPAGTMIQLPVPGKEDMEVYVTRTGGTGTKALVCIYDIFGLHPSTLRGTDLLSSHLGIPIYVPDFFRGRGWSTDNVPPREGRPAMQAHMQRIGSWEVVRPDLGAVVEFLAGKGVERLGAYGFCFGGKKLAEASSCPSFASQTTHPFTSLALIHPTNLLATDGQHFSVPVALLPSGGEDPAVMDAIWADVKERKGSVRRDFLQDRHGFASARSEWDGGEKEKRVREVYEVLAGFFGETL